MGSSRLKGKRGGSLETIEMEEGRCILVKGPAGVEVQEGELSVLGKKLRAKEHLVIPKGKAVPMRASVKSVLRVLAGGIKQIKNDVPQQWWDAIDALERSEKPVVAPIVGGTDTGKTTMTTFLGNTLLKKKVKVAVVDADVGQSDIGPPCSIAMGVLNRPVTSISELEVEDAYFVGATTPSAYPHRVVAGVKLMVERALSLGSEIVLVDTPGWVLGRRARELNITLIYALQPSIVIALQEREEAEGILRTFTHSKIRVLRLPAIEAYKRDRETRKFLRERAYRQHLSGGKLVTLDANKVSLAYTTLFSGEPLTPEAIKNISKTLNLDFTYIEVAADVVNVILPEGEKACREYIEVLKGAFSGREIHLMREKAFENLLVSFLDEKNRYLGIGVLKKIDYNSRKITVYTPVSPSQISAVLFGSVKVVENGEEIGTVHYRQKRQIT